jgi:uncharacterized protein (TIGR00369 family)
VIGLRQECFLRQPAPRIASSTFDSSVSGRPPPAHRLSGGGSGLVPESPPVAGFRRTGGARYLGGMTTPAPRSPFRREASLAELNALSQGTAMQPLGIEFTELGPDFVRATMPVDDRTRQPYGLLHGGASVLLAETLGSTAGGLCVDAGQGVVGIEINANHLAGVREGSVTGTARPLHVGRSTQVWEIRIEDEHGRLACISRLTLAVVPLRAR